MAFNLSKRPNVKIGIEMEDFCRVAKRTDLTVAHIRTVDEIESAGSGFDRNSGRPKILFEGQYFYRLLKKIGLAARANQIDPTICYPTWTKAHYIGREGEYRRLAKATEICHKFGISDGYALRSASWGRYQIMGDNYGKAGCDSVEEFVELNFLDEDNHLELFAEFILNSFLDDELRAGRWDAFALRYNGAGYKKNNYHIKLPNAFRKFKAMRVDCSAILRGQVVEVMPGVRHDKPRIEGFDNTALDNRYIDVEAKVIDETEPPEIDLDEVFSSNPDTGILLPEKPVVEPPNANESGSGEASEPTQQAEQITNIDQSTKSVPDDFVAENKTIPAPPPSGVLKRAWLWVLGLGVLPTTGTGAIEFFKNATGEGGWNLREVFNVMKDVLIFLMPYLIWVAIAFIVIWGLKEIFKQISFIVNQYTLARSDMNNVKVVPVVQQYENGQWRFAPVEHLPSAPASVTTEPKQPANSSDKPLNLS